MTRIKVLFWDYEMQKAKDDLAHALYAQRIAKGEQSYWGAVSFQEKAEARIKYLKDLVK